MACLRDSVGTTKRVTNNRDKEVEAVIRFEIRPIISTSLALSPGFLILTLANLMPLVYFGLLSTIVMFFALIGDLPLTPILLSSVQLTNVADLAATTLAAELQNSALFSGMSMLEIKKLTLLGKVSTCDAGDCISKRDFHQALQKHGADSGRTARRDDRQIAGAAE